VHSLVLTARFRERAENESVETVSRAIEWEDGVPSRRSNVSGTGARRAARDPARGSNGAVGSIMTWRIERASRRSRVSIRSTTPRVRDTGCRAKKIALAIPEMP